MNRAIKFKLKNGKIVTIRRLTASDYDVQMKFLEKFTSGPGAVQTMQYRGQPKKDKEITIKHYEKNFVIGAFDDDNMIAVASVTPQRVGHPYSGRSAGVGMMMLDKYTGNGLGSKFFQILEKWSRENNIHKLVGDVRHLNIPSITACIKNGFIITGIHYDAAFINGKWHHEYILEKILEK